MNKELIKKYITFAQDNGFSLRDFLDVKQILINEFGEQFSYDELNPNLYHLITSGKFIESVAIGLKKDVIFKHYSGGCSFFEVHNYSFIVHLKNIKDNDIIRSLKNSITVSQAIAIREGKLEEFIKTIIN